ncbi:MAG: DUF4347 domain-containing protein [Desulfobacteraceae bacterium]|nr:DUF4347 domain-containing protein [Desulfobacteraceae bacterium]
MAKNPRKKTASVHSHTSPQNGNLMLALEERYLYDAAGIASAFVGLAAKPHTDAIDHHVDSDHSVAAEKSLADVFKDAVPPAAHVQKASEIVFIDPSVTDYQKIIESIPAKDQVIILDPNKDGVQQISEVLAQQTDVKAIHIVSHGSDASLTLGNAQLSKDTIEKYSPMLQDGKTACSKARIF